MFSNHTIITKRKKSQLVAIARKEVKNSMQYNIKVNLIYFKVRVKALNTMPFSGKASFCFDSESSAQEVWGVGFWNFPSWEFICPQMYSRNLSSTDKGKRIFSLNKKLHGMIKDSWNLITLFLGIMDIVNTTVREKKSQYPITVKFLRYTWTCKWVTKKNRLNWKRI